MYMPPSAGDHHVAGLHDDRMAQGRVGDAKRNVGKGDPAPVGLMVDNQSLWSWLAWGRDALQRSMQHWTQ